MNKGAITLSFDDGRKDTFHVFMDILKPLNLPGVVYIPSGFIESGYNNSDEIGFNGLMSKEELDLIYKEPLFEIAAHGYMHKNDFDDMKLGVDKLIEWYPDIEDIGMASPHSEITQTYVINNKKIYENMGFSYVRGGRNFERFMNIKKIVSLTARKTKSAKVFVFCYKNSLNRRNQYYLHAIPIHKLTTLNQVKAMVDYCINNKMWGILEFHGIDKAESIEYTEEFCWLEDDFVELCEYINEKRSNNELIVCTPIELAK